MADLKGQTSAAEEENIIRRVRELTDQYNLDNISRTAAYHRFFQAYPEIQWSFLAGMVSRNAGWNMGDLEGYWLPRVLTRQYRHLLFLTYERANWLIFDDAYPQLLLYHYSTKAGRPLFHLFRKFNISEFIEREWMRFWKHKEKKRLVYSLIINEQNLIQKPVIEEGYTSRVFQSAAFLLQDWFHFSTVLFPTMDGRLYGVSTYHFKKLDARIEMGKRLAEILFSQTLFQEFHRFSQNVEHTGSRHDYERFFPYKKTRETPFLRAVYPAIQHSRGQGGAWEDKRKIKKKWYKSLENSFNPELTGWYKDKQLQLQAGILVKRLVFGTGKNT
ncbi:DUF2515 family protein [Peribacillus kribbensis]|uniref:DUF2515 family protein n=1 Tax=Peribacillus kribbensis TaxID=356658 RepID=UPI0003F934B1|nr:DUF2515 family protein [Peribacillus kribbensis]